MAGAAQAGMDVGRTERNDAMRDKNCPVARRACSQPGCSPGTRSLRSSCIVQGDLSESTVPREARSQASNRRQQEQRFECSACIFQRELRARSAVLPALRGRRQHARSLPVRRQQATIELWLDYRLCIKQTFSKGLRLPGFEGMNLHPRAPAPPLSCPASFALSACIQDFPICNDPVQDMHPCCSWTRHCLVTVPAC